MRDWDVSAAYFTFASYYVAKLVVNQDVRYFRLDPSETYIQARDTAHMSIVDMRETTARNCEITRQRALNGGAIGHGYYGRTYLKGFTPSKDQRILRSLLVLASRIPSLEKEGLLGG